MGREIDYLRISVTDRCNLRCRYCMPEEGVTPLRREEILSYEELLRLCRIFIDLGVNRFKVTGGEPLVRRGICDFIAALKAVEGVDSVTLTTNGALLAGYMPALLRAGIDGINISLDSPERRRYAEITRRDLLPEVLRGLEAAAALPAFKLKLNCVILPSASEDWLKLADFAGDREIAVRFIERMPLGGAGNFELTSEAEVKSVLESVYGPLIPVERRLGPGPAVYYKLEGFKGLIGFISALSHKFCRSCRRLRLTSTGFLKTCLQYEAGVNLRPLLAEGADRLRQAAAEAIYRKPAEHFFDISELPQRERAAMNRIGG